MPSNSQSMAKPRCCCCSIFLIAIAASVVFVFAKVWHVTLMISLEGISSYLYRTAEQKLGHNPPTAPSLPPSSILPQPVPPAENPALAKTQAALEIREGSDMQPDEQIAGDVPTGAVNFLEPFDPSLRPGECRLDGLLSGTYTSGATDLTMQVMWMTLPGQRRTVFVGPRTKTIDFGVDTPLTFNQSQSNVPSFEDSSGQPIHISAIGPISNIGDAMNASSIDMEPAPQTETLMLSAMQNAADSISNQSQTQPDVSLRATRVTVGGASETVQYIRAEGGTFKIAVGLAHDRVGTTDSLASIAKSSGAIAAINGGFFDCYAPGAVKMPDHVLISRGRLVARGGVGTMIGETPEGHIRFDLTRDAMCWHEFDPASPDPATSQEDQDSVVFWARAMEGLGCGPRLVNNGAVSLSPQSEGFSSSEVLTGVSVRSAVGVTSDGSIILIITHASLSELASIMLQLHCVDAMNLDGGASSGLWLRGQSLRTPGRLLSNALLILPR